MDTRPCERTLGAMVAFKGKIWNRDRFKSSTIEKY